MSQNDNRFELRIITEYNLLKMTTRQLCDSKNVAIRASLAMDPAFRDMLNRTDMADWLEYRSTYYTQREHFYLFHVRRPSQTRTPYVRRICNDDVENILT